MKVDVAIIMGSDSDWPVMQGAAAALDQLKVSYEVKIVSAHRTPEMMLSYAKKAADRGIQVIIAGAGGAAHLPGMVASMTHLPVIGVPVRSRSLDGMDSLLSIVQMPRGVPVAAMAIDNADNAGLLAARILALRNKPLRTRLKSFAASQKKKVEKANQKLQASNKTNKQ